jgi:hypothetical protein
LLGGLLDGGFPVAEVPVEEQHGMAVRGGLQGRGQVIRLRLRSTRHGPDALEQGVVERLLGRLDLAGVMDGHGDERGGEGDEEPGLDALAGREGAIQRHDGRNCVLLAR